MTLALAPLETNSVAQRDTFAVLDRAAQLALKIADTEFVPAGLRKRPEAVLAAILTGYELGVQPMVALSNIAVIQGRPTIGANLARAIILSHGHEIWEEEATITRCVMKAQRQGSSHIYTATWTMEDATRARLSGKDNWRNYPKDMLVARCTGQLWRWAFADLMAGIPYLREELEDGDVLEGRAVTEHGNGTAPPPKTRKRQIKPREEPGPREEPPEPPLEPVAEQEPVRQPRATVPEPQGSGEPEPAGDPTPTEEEEPAEAKPSRAPTAEESPQPEAPGSASPPPSDEEIPEYRGGKQPPSDAQRVAITCREARVDRHALIAAITHTKSSAKELSHEEAGEVINTARAIGRGEKALRQKDGHWLVLDAAEAEQLPLT